MMKSDPWNEFCDKMLEVKRAQELQRKEIARQREIMQKKINHLMEEHRSK